MCSIPDGVSATNWVDSYDESKSFKIIFPCRTVRSSISLFIGRTLGNCFPLANLPSIESACHQSVPHCVSNFNYRVWRDFRTSQHISGLEYMIRSKTLCLFSVLFIVESYNTVYVHHVPILPPAIWYDRGEHCLIISPSAFQLFLSRYYKSKIIINTIFVFLLQKNCMNFIYDRCVYEVKSKTAPKHVLWRKYTKSPSRQWYDHTNISIDRNFTSGRHCSIWWKENVGQILLTNKI